MVFLDQKGGFDMLVSEALALFDKVGKDQREFDQKSVKTLQDLLGEIRRGEAVLAEISPEEAKELKLDNEGRGWLKRIAWSCKLILRTKSEYLCEMFRIYPGRDSPVFKRSLFLGAHLDRPNWTLSETAFEGEDPLLVILRGLREEMGISLASVHVLEPINPGESWIDRHESSVYDRLVTENRTLWYEWVLEQRADIDQIIRRDDNVELHLGWQPYDDRQIVGNG